MAHAEGFSTLTGIHQTALGFFNLDCITLRSAAVNSRVESIFQLNLPQWMTVNPHVIVLGNICRYALICSAIPQPAFSKLFWRSNCSFSIVSSKLMAIMISQPERFYSFLHFWQAGAAESEQTPTPVTSITCLKGPSRPPRPAVPAADVCRRSHAAGCPLPVATKQQQHTQLQGWQWAEGT